ncbi:hypothetical protein FDH70_gp29 [Pseudomonas phage PaMx25]|uniref:Uncharacterized protein n=1 Tax=Pseudomonas phage PaMx25 TaxID=1175654 RepID=A0A0S0N8X3_9CAUD|nr:hypothetical protein FDH70_gp29 [Pseudomonas phage PaMx25]ALH23801.1 hypothetical protein PaMx25_29 [Pseudomonas phage PaMx25]
MPASTEPRSGLSFGWSLGENNWNTGMDANLLSIGRFAYHLSVKDRILRPLREARQRVTRISSQPRPLVHGQGKRARWQSGRALPGYSERRGLAG